MRALPRPACVPYATACHGIDAETSTDQQPVDLTPSAAALELRTLDKALTRLTARVEGPRAYDSQSEGRRPCAPTSWSQAAAAASGPSRRKRSSSWGKKKKVQLEVPKVMTPLQAFKLLSLDESHYSKYSEIIPGGLRLVESNNADATRVFKKET